MAGAGAPRLGLFLIVFAVLMSGCGSGASRGDGCGPAARCLRAGNVADPGTLDPAHAFVKQDQTVINDLLVGLTTFDAAGRAVPGIARSWSVSADALTWTFRLRPAVWSDGAPVTAADFVYSLRRLVDPATGSPYANLVYPVRNARAVNLGKAPVSALGIAAPDPATVVIRLEHPTPYLPDLLAHYGVVPVPRQAVERWGDRWTAPGRFVGNGPFVLKAWRLGDRIVLDRNPRFYDAANVCLERVVYLPINDAISAERQLKRGEIDLNAAFDPMRTRYLRGAGGLADEVRVFPWTDLIYVVFNERYPPFRDVRVRQALAMAIDREFIAGKLIQAPQAATAGFVPPGLGALPAEPDWARLPFPERQRRARALLAAAGYGPGRPLRFELKLFFNLARAAPVLQADWRAIGVEATLTTRDIPVFFSELQAGDFEAGFTDWIADYPDPTDFLDLMRSDQPGANYGGHVDLTYDDLVRRAEASREPETRARLLQAAHARLLQAAPIAPVWVGPSRNLVSRRITGWVDNVNDVHPKRWMCLRG